MNIQDLVRERVIGNIKTGKKNEKGIPEKLPYFHVEEDKGTSYDMVEIFKQLYPGQPTKLKIRFTSENPFNFKFKRYVNGKAVCIGNGTKAITVGKDSKNNNTQIEVECNEECSHRQSGKCKLKGTLKFALDGIEAGGVWNLSTSGGISLSNIASEIVKYKRAGMSIVGVPFELTLTEQQSLAYGTYYSIDLHRTDIKPQLVTDALPKLAEAKEENKQLADKTTIKEKDKKETSKVEKAEQIQPVKEEKENAKIEETKKVRFTYDGKTMEGREGEPVAMALKAAGVQIHRYTRKKHEPRGIFCAIGRCTDCVMVVDGVPNVRTCVTPLKEGMRVETQYGISARPPEKEGK